MAESRVTTLGAVCSDGLIQTGPFGSQLHAEDYVEEGVPFVMPADIIAGRVSEAKVARIAEADADRLGRHRVRPGDILYARRGDITKSALITERERGWVCGSGCLLVRPGSAVNHRWLSYWLSTPWTRDWLRQHAVGAVMPNLNTSILSGVPVVHPELPSQERIAGVLGTLDDLIESNKTQVSRLTRTAVLRHSTTAFIGEMRTFGDVASVGGGGTPSTKVDEYWGGSIAWATPTDITALSSPYLYSTTRTITPAGLDACASALYPAGSILMTSRATIGAFAVAQVPTAVNQGFIVVTPRADLDRSYLLLEMMRQVPDFLRLANGATFLELPRGRFKAMPIVWPYEQDRAKFHAKVGPLIDTGASLQEEIEELTRTRDELLPLLMSGRVRVREAA